MTGHTTPPAHPRMTADELEVFNAAEAVALASGNGHRSHLLDVRLDRLRAAVIAHRASVRMRCRNRRGRLAALAGTQPSYALAAAAITRAGTR